MSRRTVLRFTACLLVSVLMVAVYQHLASNVAAKECTFLRWPGYAVLDGARVYVNAVYPDGTAWAYPPAGAGRKVPCSTLTQPDQHQVYQ